MLCVTQLVSRRQGLDVLFCVCVFFNISIASPLLSSAMLGLRNVNTYMPRSICFTSFSFAVLGQNQPLFLQVFRSIFLACRRYSLSLSLFMNLSSFAKFCK